MRFDPPRSTQRGVSSVEVDPDAINDMSTSELRSLAKELRRSSLDAQLEIVELKVRKQFSDGEDSGSERDPEENTTVSEGTGRISVVMEDEEGEERDEDSPKDIIPPKHGRESAGGDAVRETKNLSWK